MSRNSLLLMTAALVFGCGRGTPPPGTPDTVQTALAVPPIGDTAIAPVVSPQELYPPPATAAPARTTPRPAARVRPSPATVPEAPVSKPLPTPQPPPTAKAGLEVITTSNTEITTRRNKAGEEFVGSVTADVKDSLGRVVIPAGAAVVYRIVEIHEAENQNEAGVLVIRPTAVRIGVDSYPVAAEVTELKYERKGRGVTAGDAGKVAAGAAAGAILGQILTKKTSGTVIGGAVGAAAGTAIAIKSADKDLVVPAGSRIVIRLTEDLVRTH